MKGQVSIEFIAAFFLFVLAVVGTMTYISNEIPNFRNNMEETSLHIEASEVSKKILTKPGRHSHSGGGTSWEKNSNSIQNVESFGLASEYLIVEEDKLENISSTSQTQFNYSQFQEAEGLDHQYRFSFTWFPIVDTSKSFVKGNPPSKISSVPNTDFYKNQSGPIVHYGSTTLHGGKYTFLVTSHRGDYNTTYVSDSWDFNGKPPLGTQNIITPHGEDFVIKSFQNRENTPGSVLVLSKDIKEFGAPQPLEESTISMRRYAVYNATNSNKHPLRIRVLAW